MEFIREEIEQLGASIDTKIENHLTRIEDVMTRKLNSVLEVNAMLMRENVKLRSEAKESNQERSRSVDVQMGNTGNTGNTEPSQSNVYMSPTEYGYRIWGKTFDVKDTIKTLGNVTFDGQMKSWKLQDCEMQMEEIRNTMSKVCNFEVLSQ